MYNVCVSCPKLGVSCNGPNFSALTTPEQLEWIKQRKNFLGKSNAKLAEESHTPKGTIDSLLSGNRSGANTETLRPIFEALIGGYTNMPCPNPPTEADITLEKTVAQQAETIGRQDGIIKKLKDEIARLRTHIEHSEDLHKENLEKERAEDKEALTDARKTIKFLRTVISVLVVLLILSIGTICVALIMDRMNPNIGFFWLEDAAATIFSGHTSGIVGDITGLKI